MSNQWHIPRRTFLRGLGTAVALPVLDSMLPAKALAAVGGPGAAQVFPKRVAWIYVPNGANMADWTPKVVGENYDMSMTLEPLAQHRRDFNVISGLAIDPANSHGDGGGDHARSSAAFLTGAHPRKTAGADIKAGVSVDQIAAAQIGDQTRLSSLELSCDRGQEAGSCDSGYSCAYQFNISWRSATQPMNPEIEPKAAFDRLFGSGSPDETREARLRRDGSEHTQVVVRVRLLGSLWPEAQDAEHLLIHGERQQYVGMQRRERFSLPLPKGRAPTNRDRRSGRAHARLVAAAGR